MTVAAVAVVIGRYAVVVILLGNSCNGSCGLDLGVLMIQVVVVLLLLVMRGLLLKP